ncbi:MAG: site-specific DNA-methyltransferase [Negativibacillus sp.]
MDKLKMHTPNKADENFKKLAELFPNAVTETIDENGEVVRAIDKDVLMQEISCTVVDGNEERYQFTWPDKKKSVLLANAPINKTLRPCREESVDFDTTENLYIEGDNLEVLKLLQETYLGKVKMIYIDPPYNTGSDFVYADNFAQSTDEYITNSGQFDEEGNRLVKNLDSNGRYHTDWLNMIYPRLKIAKNLLTEDGVIFISIDDSENKNLKNVCDEIFGAANFVSQLIWQNKKGGGNDSKYIAIEHEYILVYARNISALSEFYEAYSDDYIKRYKEHDEIGRFFWDTFKRKSGKQYYPIVCPDGTVLQFDDDGNPISWLRSKARFESDIKSGEIRIVKLGDKWSVQFKQRIPLGKTPRSIFTTETVFTEQGTTSTGSSDVYEYFKKDVFSNPKPVELIKFLLGFGLQKDDIVLDFFSGSATTAEAVMRSNAEGKRCKYILVQLKEDIDPMLNSASANAKRVAENAVAVLDELRRPHIIPELAKERIRRAGKKIKDENPLTTQNLDIGFRVLKCDTSNMKDIYYSPSEFDMNLLDMMADNIKEDRTPEDLLFQVMLDLGVELSSKIEETTIGGKKVFDVADGFLIACFDKDVNDETIKAIAQKQPYYFVMRDSSLANDSVATNFEQIFATYSPDTVRKVL